MNHTIEAISAVERHDVACPIRLNVNVTNRSLRIGVPERATDGQQDASHGGAIYMAAKKTAKKSTKKTGKKKSKR